jgi:hypothetical protein
MERGLTESQARNVEGDIAPGCLVVTVYGEDNPQRAADILADDNGEVIAGNTPRAVEHASRDPRTGIEDRYENRDSDVDRDLDRDAVDPRHTTTSPRIPTQRGDDLVDDDLRDNEGYVIEEFIATGRDGEPFR